MYVCIYEYEANNIATLFSNSTKTVLKHEQEYLFIVMNT